MRKIDERRLLPVLLVFIAIGSSPPAGPQSPTQVIAGQQQPARVIVVNQPPPTPEQIGDALMAHQRYQAAIEAYKTAPGNSPVMNRMGIAYQMMFDLEDALRCYKAALKMEPANSHIFNNLGTVYDGLGQYRNAERMYRKALRLDPGSSLVLKNLGSAQLAQHKYKEGWESYKAALALDPAIFQDSGTKLRVTNPASIAERGAMNYYMARGCVRAGMTERAIEYLRLALNEGFTSPRKIIADTEFASLHGVPAFEQLLAAQRNP